MVRRREGERTWREEDVYSLIRSKGPSTALIFFSGVHYSTGQVRLSVLLYIMMVMHDPQPHSYVPQQAFDIEKITALGHEW